MRRVAKTARIPTGDRREVVRGPFDTCLKGYLQQTQK
jgi:hypothetical protein